MKRRSRKRRSTQLCDFMDNNNLFFIVAAPTRNGAASKAGEQSDPDVDAEGVF